jgi:hypothetical protein
MLNRHVRIPFHPGPDRDAAVAASLLASSESVLDALEAYRKARRGERVALEVPPERIEWTTPGGGRLLLRWREEIDLACRMERAGEGLSATVGFRLDGPSLLLETLDPASPEERFDEL